jgi:hypothetical protein
MEFKTSCNGTTMKILSDGEWLEVQMSEDNPKLKLAVGMNYSEAFRLMEYLCFAIKESDDFNNHPSSPFCLKKTFWRHKYCSAQCEGCKYIEANKK